MRYTVDVPEELHTELKAQAKQQGRSIREQIHTILKESLETQSRADLHQLELNLQVQAARQLGLPEDILGQVIESSEHPGQQLRVVWLRPDAKMEWGQVLLQGLTLREGKAYNGGNYTLSAGQVRAALAC